MIIGENNKEKIKQAIIDKYKINLDFDYLKQFSNDIANYYSEGQYVIYNKNRENVYVDVYWDAVYKEYEKCSTLTEKCISRAHYIRRMQYYFEDDLDIYNKIVDMDALWLVIEEISAFGILWGMEMSGLYHIDKTEVKNYNKTQNAFEYLYSLAIFYLCETEEFANDLKNYLL